MAPELHVCKSCGSAFDPLRGPPEVMAWVNTFRCSSCGHEHSPEELGLPGVEPRPKHRETENVPAKSGLEANEISVSPDGQGGVTIRVSRND